MKFVMENSRYGRAEFSYFDETVRIDQEDGHTILTAMFPEGYIKGLIKEFEFRTTVRSYGNKRLSEIVWPAKFYVVRRNQVTFHNDPKMYADGKISWSKGSERKHFELISFSQGIPKSQIHRIFFNDFITHDIDDLGIFHTTLEIDRVEKVTYKTRNKRSHLPVLTVG